MCYIFSCFGWTLDLIQRFITFFLTCCLCYAVSVGLAVALVAGIAYGYNYSMAEFITFTRSDVTVYMKRGQFYDRPDLVRAGGWLGSRRAGGDDANMFENQLPNPGIDYNELRKSADEVKTAPEPLSGTLQKAEDTRNYAEKLVKYKSQPKLAQEALEMSNVGVHAQEQQALEMTDVGVQAQAEDSRRYADTLVKYKSKLKPAQQALETSDMGVQAQAEDSRRYSDTLVKYKSKLKPAQQALEISDVGVQAQESTDVEASHLLHNIISTMPLKELTQPQDYHELTSSPITPFDWTNTPSTPINPSYQTTTRRISYKAKATTVLYKNSKTRKMLHRITTPETRLYQTSTPISITPNLAISTAVFRSGSSPIIMRNFNPIQVVDMPRSFEDYISRTDANFGNMELVENPDNFQPSYFKNMDSSPIRTHIVNRPTPVKEHPSGESDLSEEYEESATRVHRGPKENYPMEEY